MRTGFLVDTIALDQKYLADVGEIQIVIKFRTAPDAPCFNAAVLGRCDFHVIGSTAVLEHQSDIVFKRRLIAFYGEMIVCVLLDNVGGYRTLSQEGVAGDHLSGDIAGFQQRNRHADFVRALLLITALYRQCAHFFWA